ncbi:hypothetical protein [Actinomadura sp. 3N508]|uniref:hypothetical protein n=1 Tax=Actinomadura sp. 3N508 TaxID=3375153 RepID=UPI0037998BA1
MNDLQNTAENQPAESAPAIPAQAGKTEITSQAHAGIDLRITAGINIKMAIIITVAAIITITYLLV